MGLLKLSDFRAELKARGFDGFTDSELNRYVNWGYFHVARKFRWLWLQPSAPYTTTLNPGDFAINVANITNYASTRKVMITTAGKERKLTGIGEYYFSEQWLPLDLTNSSYRDTPYCYYIFQNKIYVLPPPSTAVPVSVYYWQKVTALDSDNDTTTILPEETDEMVLSAALVRCHRRANQWELARNEFAILNDSMDDFLVQQGWEMEDTQLQVVADPAWDVDIAY